MKELYRNVFVANQMFVIKNTCESNSARLEKSYIVLQPGRNSLRENPLMLEVVAFDLWHW